jgi:hypothetical protein
MQALIDRPSFVLIWLFVGLWLATRLGRLLRKRYGAITDDAREDLGIIRTAAFTLLALVIGFMFSMAVGRYDQRKMREAAEANTIGTEYLRAELLPAADADRVQTLLRDYLDNRILFYQTRDSDRLRQINARTAKLQTQLWSAVRAPAATQGTAIVGLAVAGMNEVLDSEGYTQAAWLDRIPATAWALLGTIAVFCSVMLGYSLHSVRREVFMQLALPLLLAVALALIEDIESPRRGIILIAPENLGLLRASLDTH